MSGSTPQPKTAEMFSSSASRVDYDAELQRHQVVLRGAWDISHDDRVLDIGCGSGQTTREAARLATAGSALGVDLSAPMIERGRALAEAEGLRNVTFVHADAATHPLSPEEFDVVISRFGTMFFADPAPAFANIARALRPGGRLVMMVWQAGRRNEWFTSIQHALADGETIPVVFPDASDPFSLADPDRIRRLFAAAGLSDSTLSDVHEPVYYGPDVAAALDWTCGFSFTQQLLRQLDPLGREHAIERLRDMLAAHYSGDGVWVD
jgi:ubiquinone/menaquinone biosynthesis C-methylase UbiE